MLVAQVGALEAQLLARAATDPICRRLMTVPGVGALTALIYRATIDDPRRFTSSRAVGAHLGLVPRMHQSGEFERRGRITKHGSRELRTMLYLAAMAAVRSRARPDWLKDWSEAIAARRGRKRALVASARKLAVLMHRMWLNGTDFQSDRPAPAR